MKIKATAVLILLIASLGCKKSDSVKDEAAEGKDLHNTGNVANGSDAYQYVLLKRSAEFTGKTNEKGEGWFVIGTDSGFEGTTTLYYTNVMVNLVE